MASVHHRHQGLLDEYLGSWAQGEFIVDAYARTTKDAISLIIRWDDDEDVFDNFTIQHLEQVNEENSSKAMLIAKEMYLNLRGVQHG